MQELTFVGLSEDGSRLLLALPDGRRFALPIDERLRAATRGAPRSGRSAVPAESLRPRDVQARLRAGATTEEVAEAAGWPVERVEAFAVPVLQERGFVAQRARTSLVRFLDGELPLEEVVAHRLAERAVDPADLRWDAWRTEDGRWTVLLAYPAGRGDQVATWVFDTDSRILQPVDEEARWLSEHHDAPTAAAQQPDLPEPDEPTARIMNLPPTKERPGEQEASRHPALRRGAEGRPEQPGGESRAAQPQEQPGPDQPRSKRATVPSWDEILFGGANDEDGEGPQR